MFLLHRFWATFVVAPTYLVRHDLFSVLAIASVLLIELYLCLSAIFAADSRFDVMALLTTTIGSRRRLLAIALSINLIYVIGIVSMALLRDPSVVRIVENAVYAVCLLQTILVAHLTVPVTRKLFPRNASRLETSEPTLTDFMVVLYIFPRHVREVLFISLMMLFVSFWLVANVLMLKDVTSPDLGAVLIIWNMFYQAMLFGIRLIGPWRT